MVLARMLPSRSMWPSATVAMLLIAMLLPARPASAADPSVAKAEMLWNIAKFVQWPEVATTANATQLVFTILGEDELAGELAGLLSTKTINGRPVFVRFARRAQDARGSQILYVAASEHGHMAEVLSAVAGSPVLTVGDTPEFATQGGMIGFVNMNGKVRFEINLGHAERTGLKISAKLLAIARVVD